MKKLSAYAKNLGHQLCHEYYNETTVALAATAVIIASLCLAVAIIAVLVTVYH